jgi:hypothetical protein
MTGQIFGWNKVLNNLYMHYGERIEDANNR